MKKEAIEPKQTIEKLCLSLDLSLESRLKFLFI